MTDPLFDIPPQAGDYPCPWCGEKHDCSLSLNEDQKATPGPGDVLVCQACACPAIVQEVGKPRRPTESEWKTLNADQNMTELRKSIFMMNKGNVNYHDLDIS